MKQYEFKILKQGATNSVLCTAQTEEKALTAVRDAYAPEFTVISKSVAEYAPHHFFAEIDATR